MPEIKYKHAFVDEDREKIISIDEITEENRNHYKFRCIGCGQEILPRAIGSKYRKPHFWHGVRDGVECSGETYLHKLTKHIMSYFHFSYSKGSYFLSNNPLTSLSKSESIC